MFLYLLTYVYIFGFCKQLGINLVCVLWKNYTLLYQLIVKCANFLKFSYFVSYFVILYFVTFSTFCSSRLTFQLVFYNLSKNLIICPQHFDVLMILNRPFTTVPSVIEVSVKFTSLIHAITPTSCYLILKRRLLAHEISKKF